MVELKLYNPKGGKTKELFCKPLVLGNGFLGITTKVHTTQKKLINWISSKLEFFDIDK